MGLLTVLKGLPLSYNRDLQEDKEFFFDSFDTVKGSLKVMARMLHHIHFRREWMDVAAHQDPGLLATDLADVLVRRGVPFRKSHEIIGRVVRYCLIQKKRIQDLGDSELRLFSNRFPPGAARSLSPRSSVLGKRTVGGPAPANVAAQAAGLGKTAARLRKRLPKA
jgi:argininosuccinate lyase